MSMYWISLRSASQGQFTHAARSSPLYLAWDGAAPPTPDKGSGNGAGWAKKVLESCAGSKAIVFFVHGYNNTLASIHTRHRLLEAGLAAAGFDCTVISFDWPCEAETLAYLEDRHAAKTTAFQLVDSGIRLFNRTMRADCDVNVHVVAHSMGAFVLREAFDDADDSKHAMRNWKIGQIALFAGDISSGSLAGSESTSLSLYRHAYRLTNYFSGRDEALQISNAKRAGLAPRVGRVGLPDDSPDAAVDVDCTGHFEEHRSTLKTVVAADADVTHSWYFWDRNVMQDLAATLAGKLDRNAIPTRKGVGKNDFVLL